MNMFFKAFFFMDFLPEPLIFYIFTHEIRNKSHHNSSSLLYILFIIYLPSYRPAFVIIISVPISWNRFHRSDPCRSTRVSSPVPVTGAAHTAAGCGLSSSASSLSAAPEKKRRDRQRFVNSGTNQPRLSVTH